MVLLLCSPLVKKIFFVVLVWYFVILALFPMEKDGLILLVLAVFWCFHWFVLGLYSCSSISIVMRTNIKDYEYISKLAHYGSARKYSIDKVSLRMVLIACLVLIPFVTPLCAFVPRVVKKDFRLVWRFEK